MSKGRPVITATVRRIPHHKCQLRFEDRPANSRIYQGLFVGCRRLIWTYATIDPSNPQSKRCLKSAAAICEEQIRHLSYRYFVIHPFSRFRYFWEMFMIPVWLLIFVCIPISVSKSQEISMEFEICLDVVSHIDIIFWFFTGYLDKNKQTVELNLKKIFKHYLFTYFFFDFVSSQPISLYLYLLNRKGTHFVTILLLLKMVRLKTLFQYMNQWAERWNISASNIKFVCFIISVCVLLSWTSSAVFMITKLLQQDMTEQLNIEEEYPMLVTVFRVTRQLMTVGVTDFVNYSNRIMLTEIFFITIGSVLEVIILAKVMQVHQKHSSSRNKYNNLLEEINEYMKYKELPAHLKEKILRYVDFKFQKHIFREEDVLNNLSSKLKYDILVERCQNMVQKVDFFKDLPGHVIVRIVTRLRSEIFLPTDVIVLAGYAGHAMYFIYMGRVAVFTGNGKEICHLNDGDHFGEIALVINEPRVATVVAVKECELFKLSRKDFQEAIEPYPEISRKIRDLALSRLENTLQMMSKNKDEPISFNASESSHNMY